MKVSVSDVNATQKRLSVEVPADEVQAELDKQYRTLAKNVKIKGFRPGKVPRNILKVYYGKAVEEDVAQKLIEKTFPNAIESEGIKPLATPDLESFSYGEDGGLKYAVVVEIAPDFEAKNYKGLKLKRMKVEPPTEEDIQKELENVAESCATLESLGEDATVEEGVLVTADVTPLVDGKVDEDFAEEELIIEVGKTELYHPEFTRHLIGARVGDTVEIELYYSNSEEAPTEDWVGKKVTFYVDIHEILRKEIPPIDDELAKEVGVESLEELKKSIRERIEKQREERAKQLLWKQIDRALLLSHDIPVPEKAVLEEAKSEIKSIETQLIRQGVGLSKDWSEDERLQNAVRPEVELSVKLRLILDKIAQQEGIALDDAEVDEIYGELARVFKTSLDEARQRFLKTVLFERMKANMLRKKVYEFIEENAEIEEASEEEILKELRKEEENTAGTKEGVE